MEKKVVLALPGHSSFLIPVSNALKMLGFEVYHFDYLKPNMGIRILSTFSNFFSLNKIKQNTIINIINQELIESVRKIKPNYLLVIKGESLTKETLIKINKTGVTTINWFPDNDMLWNLLIKTASYYSYYFSVCHYLTKKLNKYGIKTNYLPVATEADEQINNFPKKYNLVFAGHLTNKRIKYFSQILDLGFDLWGYQHWKHSSLSSYYRGYLSADQVKETYRRSKIVVNVTTGDSNYKINIANLRNFETTGVGTFVLSQYNQATAELFKENKEIVFFRNSRELRRKALYYLNHDTVRDRVSRTGWLKTKNEHNYINRFKSMFKIVNNE